jgi:hypothetical protein
MAVDWNTIFKGAGDFVKKPENSSALIKSGFDLVGSAIAGAGAEGAAKYQEGAQQRRTLQDRRFDLSDLALGQENKDFGARQIQQDNADETVLGAMGESPLAFQADRARMSALADVLGRGGPQNLRAHMGGFGEPLSPETLKFLRPSAEAEQPYWNAVAQSSKGRFNGAGLDAIYGAGSDAPISAATARSGEMFDQDWRDHGAAVGNIQRNAWSDLQSAEQKELEAKKDDGGGFWGTLGKVAKFAAPIALGVATGGMSVPAQMGLQAALGGVTGALGGGGMKGAISGAVGGAASSALPAMMGKMLPRGGATPPINPQDTFKMYKPPVLGALTQPSAATANPWVSQVNSTMNKAYGRS